GENASPSVLHMQEVTVSSRSEPYDKETAKPSTLPVQGHDAPSSALRMQAADLNVT
ncbi:hypothetical protein QYM36_015212, partial [Artemia franciscana]